MMKSKMKLCFCLLITTFSLLHSVAQTTPDLSDYPLHVQYKRSAKPVLVYLTGDGGWNSFSEGLVNELGKSGYAIIALDTRKYFWIGKTPDEFARDMKVILSVYLKAWNKDSFSIIGYSFGADVGAFLPERLPVQLSSKINSVVLLSPGISTAYVVKLKNMLNFGASTAKEKYKIYPELLKYTIPVWCIFGKDEQSDSYPVFRDTDKIHRLTIPGDHHYSDNVLIVSAAVLKGL